jgi:hypothetical protein
LTVVLEFLTGAALHGTSELDTLVERLVEVLVPHLGDLEVEDLL